MDHNSQITGFEVVEQGVQEESQLLEINDPTEGIKDCTKIVRESQTPTTRVAAAAVPVAAAPPTVAIAAPPTAAASDSGSLRAITRRLDALERSKPSPSSKPAANATPGSVDVARLIRSYLAIS